MEKGHATDVNELVAMGGHPVTGGRLTALPGGMGGPPGTHLLQAADIFAPLPPINRLCEALGMAPGAPTLIAGYGYSGKTLAGQDLALAVATGTKAWGSFPVRGGRVLHIDYEQGSNLTRLRYQRLARARGIDPRELEGRLRLLPFPEWYLDADRGDELARLCEGIDFVLIDSYRAACPHTEENSSEARIPLDRLSWLSERTGITFAVIHHARKPSKDSPGGARMGIRGSGAIFDACGSVLVFSGEKGNPPIVEHEKNRITGRTHEDFQLWIEDVEADGDPTAGLRVSYIEAAKTAAGAEAAADRHADLKRRVVAEVRRVGTFQGGVNDLRAKLRANKDDTSAAVKELVTAGVLKKGGKYREPTYTYVGTDGAAQ